MSSYVDYIFEKMPMWAVFVYVVVSFGAVYYVLVDGLTK